MTYPSDTDSNDTGNTDETENTGSSPQGGDDAGRGARDEADEDNGAGGIPWKEAAGRYINRQGLTDNTRRTLRGTLGTFFQDHTPLLVDTPEDVRPETIREYLGRPSISDAYRVSMYSRLNAFYEWLVGEEHIRPGQNPMQDVERPEPPAVERPYLSPQEFAELTYAIEADYERRSQMEGRKGIKENELIWVLPPLKFATATGLRPGELKHVRVRHVDFDEETLQVPAPNKEPNPAHFDYEGDDYDRKIPLCSMALEVAKGAAEGNADSDFLFGGARSEQIDTRRLSRTVKRYVRKTGLDEELNFTNCTRHTCASWLMLLGYTSRDLMQLFGYSSVKSTEPYARLAPSLEELQQEPSAFHEEFAEATTELGFFPPAHSVG
ncbi:tyrosine-type recombinase/integrase [Salinibacter grassmerensis]|uniref:tyrosine-type recombinase/integrase n=1 Tax=Salinibacter grassmerensis TaxID=3040353 RepID=UPI0021E9A348|nr:site-specific integrase [Salinibacter grassmerensis]